MISELITQLTNETTSFVKIDNARDIQPQQTDRAELPALFLFRGQSECEPSGSDNRVTQKRNLVISIHLVCSHSDVETLENEIFGAILGWQYSANHSGLEMLKSEPVMITGQTVWYQLDFTTWNTLRET